MPREGGSSADVRLPALSPRWGLATFLLCLHPGPVPWATILCAAPRLALTAAETLLAFLPNRLACDFRSIRARFPSLACPLLAPELLPVGTAVLLPEGRRAAVASCRG